MIPVEYDVKNNNMKKGGLRKCCKFNNNNYLSF